MANRDVAVFRRAAASLRASLSGAAERERDASGVRPLDMSERLLLGNS
jgi:hypothetical protein